MSAATISTPTTIRTVRREPAPVPRLLLAPAVDAVPRKGSTPDLAGRLVLRSVLSPVTEAAWPVVVADTPPDPPLPDPTRLCGALVLATVEALGGTRPVAQLTRWLSPELFETLSNRCAEASRERRALPTERPPSRSGPSAGPRQPDPNRTPVRRATVRRTHLFRVSPTAAEASVVLHDGVRVRAAAVRVEAHRGHWRATVLQIG